MREIVQVNVGQAGCQTANACWELFCLEHGIAPNGMVYEWADDLNTFFEITEGGRAVPRTVLADLEPTVIDETRTGAYRCLFNPNMLITGKEDAASNFYLGYSNLGREMIDSTMDAIRLRVEECDGIQGFMMYRSIGGGTGSGFGDLILDGLERDYEKVSKFEVCVFPSPKISTVIVEPYNAIFSTHYGMDFVNCCFIMDNEALYSVIAKQFNVQNPTYTNLNRIISQIVSAITAALRFEGSLCVDLAEFQTNLVPYPRIHYPLVAYSPMLSCSKVYHESLSTAKITNECFAPDSQLVKCDPRDGKYMSIVLLYRGDVSPTDINTSIQHWKNSRLSNFVDWSPCGFKIGICYQPPQYVPGSDLLPSKRAVVMLSNSTAIKIGWARLIQKFNLMYSRRAFTHHYLNAGIDPGEFEESRDNLTALVDDYLEIEKDLDQYFSFAR